MPFARIVASNPSAARDTAQALRQAGYEIEIVRPGTPPTRAFDLEFDVDTDSVISESPQQAEQYVPGEREFVLKPLWRKLTSRYLASKDVARAHREIQEARVAPAASQHMSAAVQHSPVPPKLEATPDLGEMQRRASEESARQIQMVREREEFQRQEELRRQQERLRQQETARLREQTQREELARQRESELQQMAAQRQAEARRMREEEVRREAEEAERHAQVARQREELRQQDILRKRAEEEHRREVLRQRQEEEQARRAEAQRLLLAANKQREESIRQRTSLAAVPVAASVPTFREYLQQRMDHWKRARVEKAKVARIDRSGSFAWRQAWPVTAGVAAAFLLGWGVAVHESARPTARNAPPILTPGQYGAYPVAKVSSSKPTAKAPALNPASTNKRRAIRDSSVAEDEVVVHHYYPTKNVTAQNRTPQRKKISDLN